MLRLYKSVVESVDLSQKIKSDLQSIASTVLVYQNLLIVRYVNCKILDNSQNNVYFVFNGSQSLSELVGVLIDYSFSTLRTQDIVKNYIPVSKIDSADKLPKIVKRLSELNLLSSQNMNDPEIVKAKLSYSQVPSEYFNKILTLSKNS
ncbi:hypothetical protein C3I27_03565 [Campylobacter jejuni]|uniref:Uncharacterized protein n=1 Tax=Campylobacter jejuni TaxID=197 RepID=A0A430VBK7_CAMJU|nr:hypothetical protein [Campylobacter jejuni]RTI48505.1 hypothetical protein C3I27_03565 [Campylobacter jejuni]RTJ79613.1 hypothetical protein C3H57_04380 [Campylobacter jejuni]HEG8097842.1 hypothetical protein [Campylobacter jejuni]